MDEILPASTLRRLSGAYLLLLAAAATVYGIANVRAAHEWNLGEWLINYSGGFVRRGLPGELALLLARATHLNLFPVAIALPLAAYGALYLLLWQLLRDVRWSLPLLLLFFSPATLAFALLDSPAALRKECLLYLILALLAVRSLRVRETSTIDGLLLTAVAAVLVLSHEALVAYLPYLFVPLLLDAPNWRAALRRTFAPAAAALLAFGAVLLHPGNLAVADSICRSVGGVLTVQGTGVCGGAILYLARDLRQAHAESLRAAQVYHHATLYLVTGILALLPAAWLIGDLWRRCPRTARILSVAAAISGALSAGLFYVARDWGRWIHLHAVCLLLVLLRENRGEIDRALHRRWSQRRRAVVLGLLAVYATTWTLPATGLFPCRFGYFSLVRYLRGYRPHPHATAARPSS